jgi:subtilisin family serine protease
MPIRLMSGLGSQDEADAIAWAADNGADVISCSWGPLDGSWGDPGDPAHRAFVPMPDSTRLAIEHALTAGRGGKGCVICFAAGNGNESVDNDGYASHPDVVAVAACNDRGLRSVYSDTGQALVCAFPSNDFAFDGVAALPLPAPEGGVWLEPHPGPQTVGVWTTDRSGNQGYNRGGRALAGDVDGHYTNKFGGTSSACPGVAGVAALVLAVDPTLGHAEVKALLQQACDRIDSANANYDPVTGHSLLYGFGRLNAATAVALAGGARVGPQRAAGTAAPRAAARAPSTQRTPVTVVAFRASTETWTLSFTVAGAPIVSVFVRRKNAPESGQYLALQAKDGAQAGSIAVGAGDYEYTVLLQGGVPGGNGTLTVQRDAKTPVEIPVTLDSRGNGGRVGTIHVE